MDSDDILHSASRAVNATAGSRIDPLPDESKRTPRFLVTFHVSTKSFVETNLAAFRRLKSHFSGLSALNRRGTALHRHITVKPVAANTCARANTEVLLRGWRIWCLVTLDLSAIQATGEKLRIHPATGRRSCVFVLRANACLSESESFFSAPPYAAQMKNRETSHCPPHLAGFRASFAAEAACTSHSRPIPVWRQSPLGENPF